MSFSKEDTAAWKDSEVMRELEKLAIDTDLLETEEEPSWEDESDEEKLTDAVEEFSGPEEELQETTSELPETEPKETSDEDLVTELLATYNKNLLYNIEKLSHILADKTNIKAAYKVERTIQNIKALLEDE